MIKSDSMGICYIGIGEMRISSKDDEVLATCSLGSCIGLSLYDSETHIGGLIHCMLPQSDSDPKKAPEQPAMFVDTGVVTLLREMVSRGVRLRRLTAKLAGAASPIDDNGLFNIGERNYTIMRKLLWKNNILIAAAHIGGSDPRSLYLQVKTGRVTVRSKGQEYEL
jgi:chemotaxis protein CheD